MAHETYLTIKDRMETVVRPSRNGITVPWAVAAVGFTIAMATVASGLAALGFGLAAAYSGYKTVEGVFTKPKPPVKLVDSHSTKDDLRDLDREMLQTGLANNQAPIPQLTDDVPASEWRKQVSDRAKKEAVHYASHGR